MTVKEALQTIVDNRESKALNWAVNYARYGLQLVDRNDWESVNELMVQLLYVINNITHWRGPLAKEVRNTLKQALGRSHG